MIIGDNIIENKSIFLQNLDTKINQTDQWITCNKGSYRIYSINYRKRVELNRVYYYRCHYKYTTTGNSPTFVSFYVDPGHRASNIQLYNPIVNTEYIYSSIATATEHHTPTYGCLYNGDSSLVTEVTALIKNLLVYDVTELYEYLKAINLVSNTTELQLWCDTNLVYHPSNVKYDISDLLEDINKVSFNKGSIVANIVETDGLIKYSSSKKLQDRYFDNSIPVDVYNNSANGAVTITRVSALEQNSPFKELHPYVLKVTTNGQAAPGCGGIYAEHYAAANRIVIEKIVAKVPIGYYLSHHSNSLGNGSSVTQITDMNGTGNWAEYAWLYKCGTDGTFSTGGHVALYSNSSSLYSTTDVTWYVAYVNSSIITEQEYLKNYSILNNKDIIKGNTLFSKNFDTRNLFPGGDGSDTNMVLPTGWYWDTEDTAGNAKASLVQPVGALGKISIGGNIKINPLSRYKISCWIKCKADMSNFLLGLCPYKKDDVKLSPSSFLYKPNTMTLLTTELKQGDTRMYVKSNANWVIGAYMGIGFRTNNYNIGWHDKGYKTPASGFIQNTSGSDIIEFNGEYTGTTMPVGTYVCEAYATEAAPFPVRKYHLYSDNEWHYRETYFGNGESWDGSTDYSWVTFPYVTDYITIIPNYYTNDGTVPIKFADIRIEDIGDKRCENKICFKKFD